MTVLFNICETEDEAKETMMKIDPFYKPSMGLRWSDKDETEQWAVWIRK